MIFIPKSFVVCCTCNSISTCFNVVSCGLTRSLSECLSFAEFASFRFRLVFSGRHSWSRRDEGAPEVRSTEVCDISSFCESHVWYPSFSLDYDLRSHHKAGLAASVVALMYTHPFQGPHQAANAAGETLVPIHSGQALSRQIIGAQGDSNVAMVLPFSPDILSDAPINGPVVRVRLAYRPVLDRYSHFHRMSTWLKTHRVQ